MKVEAMEGFPGSLRMTKPLVDAHFLQIYGQISSLTKNIQELGTPRPGRP